MTWESGNIENPLVLMTWKPGNIRKSEIFITGEPGETGTPTIFNICGKILIWRDLRHCVTALFPYHV